MSYRVEITRRARRGLERLPERQAVRVLEALRLLEDEPFPRGSVKLTGVNPPLWRLRVGEYRVVYSVSSEQEMVVVEAIARRDAQTYERLP